MPADRRQGCLRSSGVLLLVSYPYELGLKLIRLRPCAGVDDRGDTGVQSLRRGPRCCKSNRLQERRGRHSRQLALVVAGDMRRVLAHAVRNLAEIDKAIRNVD